MQVAICEIVMHNTAKEENIQEGTVGRNNLKYSVLG
jgi:hypothetical protein